MQNSRGLHINIVQTTPIPLDATFSCAPRELLALVGPSGGGKSTLLRSIAGIFKPANCNVRVDNEVWSSSVQNIHLAAHRRRVGMVFQSYALFPHMSILNNVACSISPEHATSRKTFARQLLEQVNLAGLENRRPYELSGGQQQRVAVARALAREPKVLLLDEPFTAVDKLTRRRLYREIVRLRRELEIPVVLVTHDLDEAAMLADTMVVLHRGKTLQSGTPEQVTTRPDTPEVARLVDLRNVYDGKVISYNPADNITLLQWAGTQLLVEGRPQVPGSTVSWVIPDGCVVVQRTDRPSSSAAVNRISAIVDDVLITGQSAQISMRPVSDQSLPLHATLPLRIVRLNQINPGDTINVSLSPRDIHIMS